MMHPSQVAVICRQQKPIVTSLSGPSCSRPFPGIFAGYPLHYRSRIAASPYSGINGNRRRYRSENAVSGRLSPFCRPFWSCRSTWRRAGINTLRCLVGCTVGDFSALWILQTYFPDMGMGVIMAASMAAGITTSIVLETILLRRGTDQLSWPMAARTAMGMSLVSMIAMETTENLVDYHLTGGVVALHDPQFWVAAVLSIGAGFLAPLPYNYLRLRKYGKACH